MAFEYGRGKTAMRVAKTECGLVRGAPGNNPKFTVFRGIPYAAPPVGELRWRFPQPHEKWEGVRDCVEFGNACYQFLVPRDDLKVSEDCLYLNVYTPAAAEGEDLPVLMFIPGGAFMGGASNEPMYDGEGFCKRGVILVTINYRTGPLGMLVHRDMEKENPYGSAGNIYYLDQIAALKWVRNNIRSFGGDPDRITLMGHSSGAVAATALCSTPLTEGDLAGCIIESAPVTHDMSDPDDGPHSSPFWMDKEEAFRRGDQFAAAAGCSSLEELRKLSCEELSDVYRKMPGYLCFFRGVIDGYVFPEDPCDVYISGRHHDIPYLVGGAGDEGAIVTTFAPSAILTREKVRKYAEKFGDKAEDFIRYCDSLSDTDIAVAMTDSNIYRARMFAETQLHNHMTPAYLYCNIRRAPGDFEGAYHGFEHLYVFQTLDRDWRKYTGSDYDLSNMMAEYWANFVKHGDPNGPELPAWTPYTEGSKKTMMLDVSPWMGERRLPKLQQYKLDYYLDKYKDGFRKG